MTQRQSPSVINTFTYLLARPYVSTYPPIFAFSLQVHKADDSSETYTQLVTDWLHINSIHGSSLGVSRLHSPLPSSSITVSTRRVA